MFDDFALEELEEWKRELCAFIRRNTGVQSFTMPDGVSMTVHQDDAWKLLREGDRSIRRKLGRGGRFLGAWIRE